MARIILCVVQTFVDSEDGLVAEEPVEQRSAYVARMVAAVLAPKKAGVIAWAKFSDPDTGEWDDDPEILFQAGGLGTSRLTRLARC